MEGDLSPGAGASPQPPACPSLPLAKQDIRFPAPALPGIQLAAHLFLSLPRPPLGGRGSGGRQGAWLHGEGAPSFVLRGGILAEVLCCLSGLVGNETSHSWTMTSGGKRPNISLKFPNPRTKRTSEETRAEVAQVTGNEGNRKGRSQKTERVPQSWLPARVWAGCAAEWGVESGQFKVCQVPGGLPFRVLPGEVSRQQL